MGMLQQLTEDVAASSLCQLARKDLEIPPCCLPLRVTGCHHAEANWSSEWTLPRMQPPHCRIAILSLVSLE
jgi:hypothetical protein